MSAPAQPGASDRELAGEISALVAACPDGVLAGDERVLCSLVYTLDRVLGRRTPFADSAFGPDSESLHRIVGRMAGEGLLVRETAYPDNDFLDDRAGTGRPAIRSPHFRRDGAAGIPRAEREAASRVAAAREAVSMSSTVAVAAAKARWEWETRARTVDYAVDHIDWAWLDTPRREAARQLAHAFGLLMPDRRRG